MFYYLLTSEAEPDLFTICCESLRLLANTMPSKKPSPTPPANNAVSCIGVRENPDLEVAMMHAALSYHTSLYNQQ